MGQRWARIAQALPGRTDDAVRNRFVRLQKKVGGARLSAATNLRTASHSCRPAAHRSPRLRCLRAHLDRVGERRLHHRLSHRLSCESSVGATGAAAAAVAAAAEGAMAVDSKRGDMWTADEDAKILSGVRRRAPPHTNPLARGTPFATSLARHPRIPDAHRSSRLASSGRSSPTRCPGAPPTPSATGTLRCAPPGHHDHYLQLAHSEYSHGGGRGGGRAAGGGGGGGARGGRCGAGPSGLRGSLPGHPPSDGSGAPGGRAHRQRRRRRRPRRRRRARRRRPRPGRAAPRRRPLRSSRRLRRLGRISCGRGGAATPRRRRRRSAIPR